MVARGGLSVVGQKISEIRRGLRERDIFLVAQKKGFLWGQTDIANSDQPAGTKFRFEKVRIYESDSLALEGLANGMNVAVARDCVPV